MIAPNTHPALMLNADFRPLSLFPIETKGWQDAVASILKGSVMVVEEYDTVVRSNGSDRRGVVEIRLPSVLALKEYQHLDVKPKFTRMGVYLRDRFSCAYCGNRFPMHQLTFDHVVPRSKGGRTNWKNIVTACGTCNGFKGDKDLVELERRGMKLKHQPFVPSKHQLNEAARRCPPPLEHLHESWLPYLGFDQKTVDQGSRVTTGPSSGLVFPADMTDTAYWSAELDAD